ncbi:MAG: NAD-dependent epimerase/dehydratase family protein [Oscillospiraceae bacterium]|nr:NAD-dependent epimerase/dehydratase family protein [Oscillospiraceae bacterium]
MEQRKIKCLVTGATGYVGTVLVKNMYDYGYDVTSLALPGDDTEFVSQYSKVRYADVCDEDALEREATGFDVVVHLAGIIDISVRNRKLIRRVNIGGTQNVAELCHKRGMKMIYCSSVHSIPCLPNDQLMTETVDFDPKKVEGTYGKTKAEATKFVLEMTRNGLDAMVAFPSGIIGPYERRVSNIGALIIDFLCGGLTAYTSGQYNFVDVRDVANGIRGMIEHWKSGECYILSGHVVTVEQMISEIAKASGKKMLRVKMPYWFALGTSYFAEFYYFLMRKKPLFTHYSMQTLQASCKFSNRKAKEDIGFSSRPFQESLSDMTHWIMDHFIIKVGKKYKPCPYK